MQCPWLDTDVVAVISAFAPDPRPLLLSCRAYYAVFDGIPDVAYWRSGRDLTYLLPKHVPDVWNGYLNEIVAADNIVVFNIFPEPQNLVSCIIDTLRYDSADIFTWLYKKDMTLTMRFASSLRINIPRIAAQIAQRGSPGTAECRYTSKLAYKIYGGPVSFPVPFADFAANELMMLTNPWDYYANNVYVAHVLWTVARTYPRPDYSFKRVLTFGTMADVVEYVRLYNPPLTPVTMATAAKLASGTEFMYLYKLFGREMPWFVKMSFDRNKRHVSSVGELEFYRSYGCDLSKAPLTGTQYWVGFWLRRDTNIIIDNLDKVPYSRDMAAKLEKFGITLPLPTSLNNFAVDDVIAILSDRPDLINLAQKLDVAAAQAHKWIDFLRTLPGSESVVKLYENNFNYML